MAGLRKHLPAAVLLFTAIWLFAASSTAPSLRAGTAETPTTTPSSTPTATLIPSALPRPTLYEIDNEDGYSSFTVAWSAVQDAEWYKVKEQKKIDGAWSTVYEGPDLSVVRSSMPYGKYCYRVRAFNEIGYSEWSTVECTAVKNVEPGPTATSTSTATPTSTATSGATPTATETPDETSTPTASPMPTMTGTPPPGAVAVAYLPVIRYQEPPVEPPGKGLFVGLTARWDGRGFVQTDAYYEPGTHRTMTFTETDGDDIIKAEVKHWYDPNPLNWEPAEWDESYSVSSANLLYMSQPGDPAFKWDYYRILPYRYEFKDGQSVIIDGQSFAVSGPHWGYGSFGQQIIFWRLVNQEKFLSWDDGSGWQLYVHPGDVTLEYDPVTRLLLKSDLLRHYYLDGELIEFTIQYVSFLTASNAYPSR